MEPIMDKGFVDGPTTPATLQLIQSRTKAMVASEDGAIETVILEKR
jgi:hypothetical protein